MDMRRKRVHAVAAGVLVAVAATFAMPETSEAKPIVAQDASVIVEWNEITQRTLAENAVAIPPSGLYYAFTALAMYDAVVSIEGGYEPWAKRWRAPRHASSEVAAATAAYLVLRHYFPNSAAALDADFAAALRNVRGFGRLPGLLVGIASAATLIHLRSDDGRDAVGAPTRWAAVRRR